MSKTQLKKITDNLPLNLRNDVNGYVQSIIEVQEQIFKENGIKFSADLSDKFIFLIGIKRIIQFVDNQYWVMNNSFAILKKYSINSIKIGAQSINKQSEYYKEISELRASLMKMIKRNGLIELMSTRSHGELLKLISK